MSEINNINSAEIINSHKAFMRRIEIVFKSKLTKSQFSINNFDKESLNIEVRGVKEVAINKDKGTISITNLEYDTLMKIVLQQYYYIEIYAGYRGSSKGLPCVFRGEVSFISQKIHSRHDTTTYITYASPMVAAYSQSRLNFKLNSGFNVYGALNYLFKMNGINAKTNISPTLKRRFLQNVYNDFGTYATVFENIGEIEGNYMISTDGSEDGSVVNVFDIDYKRRIHLDPNMILISKGNPTVTSAGLKVSILPGYMLSVGDILVLDNATIDTSISNADNVTSTFNTNYLDQNGEYMIMEIEYVFQSRGSAFELNILGRALDIIKKVQLPK